MQHFESVIFDQATLGVFHRCFPLVPAFGLFDLLGQSALVGFDCLDFIRATGGGKRCSSVSVCASAQVPTSQRLTLGLRSRRGPERLATENDVEVGPPTDETQGRTRPLSWAAGNWFVGGSRDCLEGSFRIQRSLVWVERVVRIDQCCP